MTREKIIELARQSGFKAAWIIHIPVLPDFLERFAEQARNEALEEAIKLCLGHESCHWGAGARACAAAIRELKNDSQ